MESSRNASEEIEILNTSSCLSPSWSNSSVDDSIYVINAECSYADIEPTTGTFICDDNNNEMLSFDDSQLEHVFYKDFEDMPGVRNNTSMKESQSLYLSINSENNFPASNTTVLAESTMKLSETETLLNNEIDDDQTECKLIETLHTDENDLYMEVKSLNHIIQPSGVQSILIFLSNENAIGGGEIIDYKWSSNGARKVWENKENLKVKYKSKAVFQRVLAKRFFKFQIYEFEVCEDLLEIGQEANLESKSIILTGCDANLNEDIIRMFAENLCSDENNYVDDVTKSRIFKNTYTVCFKSDINMLSLRNNFEKCCALLKYQNMKLIQAESTKCIVFRELIPEIMTHRIESCLTSKTKCHKINSSLKVIEFETHEDLNNDLEHIEHNITDLLSYYEFEVLPNFELLNVAEIEENVDVIKLSKLSNRVNRAELVYGLMIIVALLFHNIIYNSPIRTQETDKYSTNSNKENFQAVQPYILLNSNSQPNIHILNYFKETEFKKFKNDLERFSNTKMIETKNPHEYQLIFTKILNEKLTEVEYNEIKKRWTDELNRFLDSYFEVFDTKILLIRAATIDNLLYNRLRVNLKVIESSMYSMRVEICGYKDSINDFISKNLGTKIIRVLPKSEYSYKP